MVTIRRVALVAMLTVGAALPIDAQPNPTVPRIKEIKDPWVTAWLAAARQHLPAKVDEPLTTVAAWPIDRADRVLRLLLPAAEPETLAQGLVLHTDIALVERTTLDTQGPSDGPVGVVVIDGRQTRVIRRSAHWAIARRIAAEMAERPAGGAGAAAWYRATCALMQEWAELDTLAVQLEAGLALFGRDPVLALQKGTLHQTFGDARLKDYVRQRRALASSRSAAIGGDIPRLNRGPARNMMPGPPAPPPGSSRVSPASRAELNAAEREFRRALSLDPLLHEARIRLAHVLSRLGDARQAVAVVEPALQADLAPFSEFYAAIVLGRSLEHLGRFADAGAAYDRAAARAPGAQSAEIGRSRVALAQGRAAEALTMVAAVTGADAPERDDPWTVYFRLHDPDADALMQAWRGIVK